MTCIKHILPLVLAVLLMVAPEAEAQQQKIGYVHTDNLLEQMPEYRGIQQELTQVGREWKQELDRMQQEIDRLRREFADKEILYTDEVRNQRREEIQQLVQQREQYLEQKFGAEGEYYQRQQRLLEPIQRRVFEAINSVAVRNGYDFVFDRSADNGMIFFKPEWNLNQQVAEELGITQNDASN